MKDNLQMIYAAQSIYIKLFDTVLSQKIGQELDYDDICNRLKKLMENLIRLRDLASTEDTDIADKKLVVLFVDKLGYAVGQLYLIANRLGKKANNRGSYGWWAYRKDLGTLRHAQKEYQKLGGEMNRLFKQYV